jgi:hypothetical protein
MTEQRASFDLTARAACLLRSPMSWKLSALVLAIASSMSACTSQNLCSREFECRENRPDDDFVNVCATKRDVALRSLRANKEEECFVLADAIERLDACRASLDCDDFFEADLGQKCDEELEDFDDARDVGRECSSTD